LLLKRLSTVTLAVLNYKEKIFLDFKIACMQSFTNPVSVSVVSSGSSWSSFKVCCVF